MPANVGDVGRAIDELYRGPRKVLVGVTGRTGHCVDARAVRHIRWRGTALQEVQAKYRCGGYLI